MSKNRVIVAMSGGVDSSVAAALLHKEGYEVIGITMKTWGFMEVGGAPKHESGCCSLDAIYDAKNVATQFGFPHYTVDFTESFENAVIDNFVDEYFAGRTPNPCVICNKAIKWEELLEKANQLDAQYVATGHYASMNYNEETNRYCIINSADSHKDQTYALWGLTQESLSRTLLPLGKYTKKEIRLLANEFKLKSANKPESMEICFVADNDYERFLRERVPEKIAEVPEGDIIYHGEVVGKHRGIPFYTVGQRKGLGIALGKPVYVKKIDVARNIVEVADKEELLEYDVIANQINYVSSTNLKVGEQVIAKIRYSDPGSEAEVISSNDNEIKLKFITPKTAITPGQSLVLYNHEGYVLAGGIIDRITD
ncbi:MAG: tRNA 2-thiouridine(34) synthase MnmA [Melioribacteraceae bacterium]|jgi:tRNA-specific 2-thiouridylase|nr:tRNA 2-thiouridine(34) synthase MnmA [Melioribacteraceae bacterium]